MHNVNNNLRMPAMPAVPINQNAPHVAIQIEEDAPPPAVEQALLNPRNAPGWIEQMRQNMRHGAQVLGDFSIKASRLGVSLSILGTGASGGLSLSFYGANESTKSQTTAAIATGAFAALGLLSLTTLYIAKNLAGRPLRQQELAARPLTQLELADRPLTNVINDFRAQRASSSSANKAAFDWSRPGLLIDTEGMDVSEEASHYLNRLLDFIQKSPSQNKKKYYKAINEFIDSIEQNAEERSWFATQVKELNGACLNRNVASINDIMRRLKVNYPADMSIKEFLLRAITRMALNEADSALINHVKTRDGHDPYVGTFPQLQNAVVRALRKKIPGLPQEKLFNKESFTDLSPAEVNAICRSIVDKVTNPEELAGLLRKSKEENDFLEKRLAGELNHLKWLRNAENRYAKFAEKNNKDEDDLTMDEITKIDTEQMRIQEKDTLKLYVKIIENVLG